MKRFLLFIVLLFSVTNVFSQKFDFRQVVKPVNAIPYDSTRSIESLVAYISAHFDTPKDRVMAVYYWIANNISYDLDMLKAGHQQISNSERIKHTLTARRDVCQGYSEVFNSLCQGLGIPSVTISGYTRQKGKVMNLSHGWNAVLLDNKWYLMDPTWASGFVNNGSFTKKFSSDYFMVPPDKFILTHCPFDPLWQFLDYPFTHSDFINNDFSNAKQRTYFNFNDSLAEYNKQTKLQQTEASARRIKECGIENQMIADEYNLFVKNAEIYKQNEKVKAFNENVDILNLSTAEFNAAVAFFNQYNEAKNRQFKGMASDQAIQAVFDSCQIRYQIAKTYFAMISNPDAEIGKSIAVFKRQLNDMSDRLEKEQAFLKKYFNTRKPFRKALFYHN